MISIPQNVGLLDRSIRLVAALLFLGLGLYGAYSPIWQAILLLLGTAELLTSISGY